MPLTTLVSASATSSTPGTRPSWTSSASDSNIRYGLIALAPKPISVAKWCTSRGSPDSSTRPVCRRVPSRTRWWWTDPTASSDGIGARSGPSARSERIRTLMPSASAALASAQTRSTAAASPSAPSVTGQVMSSVRELKTLESTWRSFSSSPLRRIGVFIASWRACSGPSSSRLRSEPTPVPTLITIASRIGSIGGLVTCAKSCLK